MFQSRLAYFAKVRFRARGTKSQLRRAWLGQRQGLAGTCRGPEEQRGLFLLLRQRCGRCFRWVPEAEVALQGASCYSRRKAVALGFHCLVPADRRKAPLAGPFQPLVRSLSPRKGSACREASKPWPSKIYSSACEKRMAAGWQKSSSSHRTHWVHRENIRA